MTKALVQLLDHPIDYAGVFPPASLSMNEALDEYLQLLESEGAWLVDRFVVGVAQLPDLAAALSAKGYCGPDDHALIATVVGTKVDSAKVAKASFKQDFVTIQSHEIVPVGAYEVKIPSVGAEAAVKALVKSGFEEVDCDLYVELPWNSDLEEAMGDVASVSEEVGFKARLGGQTADMFPTAAQVSAFVASCSGLDIGFKFTAGLHRALPNHDPITGFHYHGFLNVMSAAALAISHDLNRFEVARILCLDEPGEFFFGQEEIRVGGHILKLEDLVMFWNYFGGFGSCSVEEPLESLAELGYLRP